MTLHHLPLPLFGSLLLSACIAKEPEPLGNVEDSGDDQGQTDSGGETDTGPDNGSSDGGSATSVGDTGMDPVCDPGTSFFGPASCPMGPTPQLPAEGCYEECAGEGAPCSTGTCTLMQIEPCPCPPEAEACCGACMAETWLCYEGSPDEACDDIVGTTFQSVEQQECGLGKDGPILCNWTLDFGADGSFLWMYSDIGEGSNYTCIGGVIMLEGLETPDHSYDPGTGILDWDGLDYEAVP